MWSVPYWNLVPASRLSLAAPHSWTLAFVLLALAAPQLVALQENRSIMPEPSDRRKWHQATNGRGFYVHYKGKFNLFPVAKGTPFEPKLPEQELDSDFKKQYPPDAQLGRELDDNARVWRLYRNEAIQHDDGRLAGWNNTVNILLTFAGLFSAAVTAFVVESYQFLQPDEDTHYIASTLYALLLATNDTRAIASVSPPSPLNPRPSALDSWINNLWFTSLFLSLAAALLCILVKQWLDEYIARTRGSSRNPRHWSRRREFYSAALDSWGVPGIISTLPLLLHLALFFFLAGISALLWSLDLVVAGWLCALTGLLVVVYIVSVSIPFWSTACPYATPLVSQLRRTWINFQILAYRFYQGLAPAMSSLAGHVLRLRLSTVRIDVEAGSMHQGAASSPTNEDLLIKLRDTSAFDRLLQEKKFDRIERENITTSPKSSMCFVDLLDKATLQWLLLSVSDSDANAVAFQALGAMAPYSALAQNMAVMAKQDIDLLAAGYRLSLSTGSDSQVVGARVLRSLLCTGRIALGDDFLDLGDDLYWAIQAALQGSIYPDIILLSHVMRLPRDEAAALSAVRSQAASWHQSGTFRSTARLLLRIRNLRFQHVLHILLCLDMKPNALEDAEWKVVFGVLRENAEACPRQCVACTRECLPELLAQLLMLKEHSKLRHVLSALLDLALQQAKPVGSSTLRDLPFLLKHLISDDLAPLHSQGTIMGLRRLLFGKDVWLRLSLPIMLDGLLAARHLLHASRLTHSAEARSELAHPYDICTAVMETAAPTHPYSFGRRWRLSMEPSTAATALLLRQSTVHMSSIWELLDAHSRVRVVDAQGWLRLCERIAVTLCAMSRQGHNVRAYVDAFFASMRLLDIVEARGTLATVRMDLTVGPRPHTLLQNPIFPRIAQHCIELRASWWLEGLNDAMQPRVSRSVADFAFWLGSEVSRLGQCSDCLGPRSSRDAVRRVAAIFNDRVRAGRLVKAGFSLAATAEGDDFELLENIAVGPNPKAETMEDFDEVYVHGL